MERWKWANRTIEDEPCPGPLREPRRLNGIGMDVTEDDAEIHAQLGTSVMIRSPNWKLVYDPQAGGVQQLFNLVVSPRVTANLVGVAGYESVTADLVARLLSQHIRLHQHTHVNEEQRVQRVHIA